MIRAIIRRVLWTIPVLFTVVAMAFLLMHAAPGSPWEKDPSKLALVHFSMDEATMRALDRRFGLDKPLWRQFMLYVVGDFDQQGEFICGLACGNLGPSLSLRGRSVQDILFSAPEGKTFWESAFGYSLRLGVLALLFAVAIGIPVGVIAAVKQNTWIDYLVTLLATLGISIPNFVVGLVLIVLIVTFGANTITVVPRSWSSNPLTWILPAAVLSTGTLSTTARLTRTSMLEVMRQDYVRTARAKGLKERVVINRHILKNALIPVITMIGPALAELIAGSFIIEMMFGFPGMGRTYANSITNFDYPLIMGATLLYALLVVLFNLSVDLAYGLLDPRIRIK